MRRPRRQRGRKKAIPESSSLQPDNAGDYYTCGGLKAIRGRGKHADMRAQLVKSYSAHSFETLPLGAIRKSQQN